MNQSVLYAFIGIIIGTAITTLVFVFGNLGMTGWGMHNNIGSDMCDGTTIKSESQMGGMMGKFEGKTGDDLDRAFLSEMIIHHQDAITMSEIVKESTKRNELKVLAENIITAQNMEIEQMREWLNVWYKE